MLSCPTTQPLPVRLIKTLFYLYHKSLTCSSAPELPCKLLPCQAVHVPSPPSCPVRR